LETSRKVYLSLFASLLVVLGVLMFTSVRHQAQVEETYSKALNCVSEGAYEQAEILLKSIEDEDYGDTASILALIYAMNAFEREDTFGAQKYLNQLSFKNLTSEQQDQLDAFVLEMTEVCKVMRELQRIEREAKEIERIRNGVPFVGMSESKISSTSLGSPKSEIRHNYECINGEQYLANLYDFVSGGRVIFTARCVRGKVTEVWDNRNDEPYVPSYRPSKPKDDTIEEDPYNAKDYSNEEDFYYDNYDDFFDYYDAEAYWQEYHD
jgi:hypothetical protein